MLNASRVLKATGLIMLTPAVVKSEWTEINVKMLHKFQATVEDAQLPISCEHYKYRIENLCYDETFDCYMIPYGFAREARTRLRHRCDQLSTRGSRGGEIDSEKHSDHYYSRLAKRDGIPRKQNNRNTPTNRC
jgi:hypothetical protein